MIHAFVLFDWYAGNGIPLVRPRLVVASNAQAGFFLTGSVMTLVRLSASASPSIPARASSTRPTLAARAEVSPRLAAEADINPQRKANPVSVTSSLTFFRGEDITIDFTMSPPQDITGWTLSFKVADTLGGTVQFTKTPSLTDAPRGKFRVVIANADTSGLTVGRYVWDCRRTDSGNKTTVADGTLDLKQEVTA